MKSSADRLMRIVDDFLNITTLKIGTSILDLSDRSLKPAIESIIEELQPEIMSMGIVVSWPHGDNSWPKLKIDYDKMREILFIVVENAVRYNREGGTVTISTKTGGGSFELSIKNTGIGITQEERQKIGSSLFYRGECARKAHPIGMGIGLSVVKAIVKAHHGSFSIESKGKGEGARVTVRLPVVT
jgi:two-component system phosphate regulon sensor histidine kinase PhoR